MAAVLKLLRRVQVSAMPDADWGPSQVTPAASICADITGVRSVGAVFRACTAAGVVVNPSGTVDLQPVEVGTALLVNGAPAVTVVRTGAADLGVAQGVGLTYATTGVRMFTIRVAAQALAGTVAYIDIYWSASE